MKTAKTISTIINLILMTTSLAVSQKMSTTSGSPADRAELTALNKQFIKNFIAQDTIGHNKIIHRDFVCIVNSGRIVERPQYMKAWANGYENGGYTSFLQKDEVIRIFGNTALVRSMTPWTRVKDGVTTNGADVYTDTYIKEDGRWWCVQAQITAIKQK